MIKDIFSTSKSSTLYRISVIILFSLLLLFNSKQAALANEQVEQKQVLFLFSYPLGTPWQSQTRETLHESLHKNQDIEINIIAEFPWINAAYDDEYSIMLFDYYRNKFHDTKFDIIIPISTFATVFVMEYGEQLFPGTPIVALPGSSKERLDFLESKPNWTGVFAEKKIKETIDVAIKLQPETENVVVIAGSSRNAHTLINNTKIIQEEYRNYLNFIYLTDLAMGDIIHQVSSLPENTVILYLLTLMDSTGEHFIPKDILKEISSAANAPVYGLWDTLMESEIMEGYMVSPQYEGKALADIALRILKGEDPADIPFNLTSNAYFFDWTQLKKWNIKENTLPVDSIILNRHYSIWDLYKRQIISVIAVVIVQSFLITLLLIFQSRLKKARKSLLHYQKELELKVIDRTKKLTSSNNKLKLEITNHKTARTQIQALLEEKELILTEVHHRIKNNMSTVMELLFLQSMNMKNEEAAESLNNAGDRIQSMMLLYDKLYRGSVFENMQVKDYLETLITEIISNRDNSKQLLVETNIEEFMLDSKTIFNLGIILNELITNVVKYAFSNTPGGKITVSASINNNHITIIIQDNGIGLPEKFDLEKSQGFGLNLVNLLIIQLKGNIKIEGKEGTKFILEFDRK